MFYSVVLLDGKELHCLTLEDVQDLFFKRRINQESLVCTAEEGKWQMLKRTFDLAQWIPNSAPPVQTSASNNFPPTNNPFAQEPQQPNLTNPFQTPANNFPPPVSEPAPAYQGVTFNQFPPAQTSQPDNPYTTNVSNGYSQNNQTETYYQAETNQTNYNFQNNQPNFAPSKYSAPANSYNYTPNYASQPVGRFNDKRTGLKQAGVFLLINLFFYVIFAIIASFIKDGAASDGAQKVGETVGKLFIPIILDLIFIPKLLKLDDEESARKWGLFRTYWSVILFCIIVPFVGFNMGNVAVGVFFFLTAFFFCISLMFVLHGKENPSQSRVMLGVGSFAIYFLIMLGTLGFSIIGAMAPHMAKLNSLKNAQYDKYKVEGKEFQDKTTGAKVALPEGWSMLKLDNPIFQSPEARMVAIDNEGERLAILEVVPVPGNLDLKRQDSTFILDQLSDGVSDSMKEQARKESGFGEKNSVKEVTRVGIFVGKHPAKLLVFDKTMDGTKFKVHVVITYDELTFYVLQTLCPAAEYEKAQQDFQFFEKNFNVPEKINSNFTQSAENEPKR